MFGSALHSLVSQLGQGASLISVLAQSLSPEVFEKLVVCMKIETSYILSPFICFRNTNKLRENMLLIIL